MTEPLFRVRDLSVTCKTHALLTSVNLDIPEGDVFGLIGSSGAGKSTFLKSLNRLVELAPELKVRGSVEFKGRKIYDRSMDADQLRSKVGMLFQQPVVFPSSILGNVVFGIRHLERVKRRDFESIAEEALKEACLWEEVKDRLRASASQLSIGQQQRLCLARTLACKPEVILMDEPTSALDPKSTESIEELILRLKGNRTIVLVTHNTGQAERLCGAAALFEAGQIKGVGLPCELVTNSRWRDTRV